MAMSELGKSFERAMHASQAQCHGDLEPPSCLSCRYWVESDEPEGITSEHGWGECRLLPPRVVVVEGRMKSVFPVTTGNVWCGELRERGQAATTVTIPLPSE